MGWKPNWNNVAYYGGMGALGLATFGAGNALAGGMGITAGGGLLGLSGANTATLMGLAAAHQTNQLYAAQFGAQQQAPAQQVAQDTTIPEMQEPDQATLNAQRRAERLAQGRQGSIKTSGLGLPGGGAAFAQKQLLGS